MYEPYPILEESLYMVFGWLLQAPNGQLVRCYFQWKLGILVL